MNLKDLKIDLPKSWRETSRSGAENQIYIRLYHISPLAHIDPKIFQDQSLPSPNPNVSITKVGVPTPGPQPLKNFYEMMKTLLSVGYLPGWTSQKLDEFWKQMTQAPGAERPGESDFSGDITITRHQTEGIARQNWCLLVLILCAVWFIR